MVASDPEMEKLDLKIRRARSLAGKRRNLEIKFDRASGYVLDWLKGKGFIPEAELSRFPEINFFIDVIHAPPKEDHSGTPSIFRSLLKKTHQNMGTLAPLFLASRL